MDAEDEHLHELAQSLEPNCMHTIAPGKANAVSEGVVLKSLCDSESRA